jgi:hypothetical protein
VSEPFFAEEDDGRLEDEAHRVKLEAFLDLAQEVGNRNRNTETDL